MIIRIFLLSTALSLHTTHAALTNNWETTGSLSNPSKRSFLQRSISCPNLTTIQSSDKHHPPANNIHDAAYLNQLKQVATLLAQGANPNEKDDSNSTPLHSCQTPEMTKLLLQHGALVNKPDSLGNTPLHLTCDSKQALVLLEHGADPSITNKRNDTALHGVGGIKGGARVVIPFLLEGALLDQKNCDGHTPLDCTVIMLLAALLKKPKESANEPTPDDIFQTLRSLILQAAFQNPSNNHRASALALFNEQTSKVRLNNDQQALVRKTKALLSAPVTIQHMPHKDDKKPTTTKIYTTDPVKNFFKPKTINEI